MAPRDLLAAERLLAALLADGCVVTAEGDRLIVEGPPTALTDAKRAAITARKPELLALLAIEKASVGELAGDDAVDPPLTSPESPPRSLLAGFAMAGEPNVSVRTDTLTDAEAEAIRGRGHQQPLPGASREARAFQRARQADHVDIAQPVGAAVVGAVIENVAMLRPDVAA